MRVRNSSLNIVFGMITLVFNVILGFILSKIFLNNLGVEYNGLNGVFNNIINILAITELGIAGAINYALYKPISEKDYEKVSSILCIYKKFYKIVGITIFTLSLLVMIVVPYFFKDRTLSDSYIQISFILCAINTIISYFFAYNRNLFYAMQKNYITSIIDFIFRLLKYTTQIITLIIYKNFIIYLSLNICFTFLNNFVIHLVAKKYYKEINVKTNKIDKKIEKEILNSVKKMSLVQILSTLINFTDNLIISSLISVKISGMYVNYNYIFNQLTQIINTFFHGMGASIGNLIAENNKNKIKEIFTNLQYISIFIGLFCVPCLLFLTEPFIELWIGKEYLLSYEILIILVMNFYLMIQRQPINYYMNTGGYFQKLIKPLFIETIINLIVSIYLAIKIGLIGVFIGTLSSSIISYLISSKRLCNIIELKYSNYWIKEIKYMLLNLLNIFIIYFILSLFLPNNLIFKLVYIFIICAFISIVEILYLIFRNDELNILNRILNNILKKLNFLERLKHNC